MHRRAHRSARKPGGASTVRLPRFANVRSPSARHTGAGTRPLHPPRRDLIYLENMSSGLYLEDALDVRRYVSVFDYLRAAALSPADTATMLMNAPNNLA
ncbi:Scr1 family TA system antitoxin-like transcriptional regulator [Streptosporangium sp. NBC_01469]|uniref:Scr1 family TA system antitoxin-like transcriptional regulator n=1 Tax=Streptosporangium sp. NBC_01469 TaxID=2903898 RepID=UPI002E2E1B61|nr:Scr1 family TA system antitoxin-like transcriptional regulator [Streptosporangium sp. NBC_01469]